MKSEDRISSNLRLVICGVIPILIMMIVGTWNEGVFIKVLIRCLLAITMAVDLFLVALRCIKYIRRYQLYIAIALILASGVVALTNWKPLFNTVPSLLIIGTVLFLAWNTRWCGARETRIAFFLLMGWYVLSFIITVIIRSLAASIAVSVSFFVIQILAFKWFFIGSISIGGDKEGKRDHFVGNLFMMALSAFALIHFYANELAACECEISISGLSVIVLLLQAVFIVATVHVTRRKNGLVFYLSIAAEILLTVEVVSAIIISWGVPLPGAETCPFFCSDLFMSCTTWFLLCFILYPYRKLPEEDSAFLD